MRDKHPLHRQLEQRLERRGEAVAVERQPAVVERLLRPHPQVAVGGGHDRVAEGERGVGRQPERALAAARTSDREGLHPGRAGRPGLELLEGRRGAAGETPARLRRTVDGDRDVGKPALPERAGTADVVADRDEDRDATAQHRVEGVEHRLGLLLRQERVDEQQVVVGIEGVRADLVAEAGGMPLGVAGRPPQQPRSELGERHAGNLAGWNRWTVGCPGRHRG